MINDGIDEINAQDECMRTCLKAQSQVRSTFLGRFAKVLLLLPCMLGCMPQGVMSQQVTQTAEYRQAENSIDRICPDLIVGYEDSDCELTAGYYQKLEAASREGKTFYTFPVVMVVKTKSRKSLGITAEVISNLLVMIPSWQSR